MQINENASTVLFPPKILQVHQCNCKHKQGKTFSSLFTEKQCKLKWDYCFILHKNNGLVPGILAVSLPIKTVLVDTGKYMYLQLKENY